MESKKAVIMVCGNPATGKTISSQKIYDTLSEKSKVSLLTTLSIRNSLKLMDLDSKESRDKIYEEIAKQLDKELSNGRSIVILDGNFNKKNRREGVYSVIDKHNTDFYAVLCKVNSMKEIEKRIGQRKENPHNIQNKADDIKLYEMIDKETEPIEKDNINGKKVNIPSCKVRMGDVISVDAKGMAIPEVKKSLDAKDFKIASWLTRKAAVGKISGEPKREDITEAVSEQDIVEFYSR